jgi:hypothetical protein
MGVLTGKADVVANMPPYNSKAENWIQWHNDLKSNFGKKIANGIWLKAWRLRGNKDINTSELRTYMKKQGVTIDASGWDKFSDATTEGLSSWFQMSKTTSFVITGTVVGLAIYIVYKVLKNPKESIQTASLFTPQGRAISMGGGFNR